MSVCTEADEFKMVENDERNEINFPCVLFSLYHNLYQADCLNIGR